MNSPFAKFWNFCMDRHVSAGFSFCARVLFYVNILFFTLGQVTAQEFGKELSIHSKMFLPTKGIATGVAWSPNGQRLAAISDFGGKIIVWESQGALIGQFDRKGIYVRNSIGFIEGQTALLIPPSIENPSDGQYAFAMLDINSGKVVKLVPGPAPEKGRPSNGANIFAVAPDGKYVANIVSNYGEPTTIFDATTWLIYRKLSKREGYENATALAFSAIGNTLAIGQSNGTIDLYDIGNPSNAPSILDAYPRANLTAVGALAFSPDDQFLAIGEGISASLPNDWSEAKRLGHQSLKIWDVRATHFVASDLSFLPPVRQLSWGPDGRYLAVTAADQSVRIYVPTDFTKPAAILRLSNPVTSAIFAPDANEIAVATGNGIDLCNHVKKVSVERG